MLRRTSWMLLIAASALLYCVLSFYRTSEAAPKTAPEPFANAVQQRSEMIAQLKEIRDLLKEQNELLRSGNLTVKVAEPEKR